MTIELEFWDEKADLAIAHLHVGDPPLIPNPGDRIDVPDQGNPGKYVYGKVTSRHFYYMGDGALKRVRVSCQTS